MKKQVAFHNLGCKVNSYEMDVMWQNVQNAGYEIVQFSQKADIYIINTCTVTSIADRKSRQMIHRAKQLNPDAIVVAVGCYVQTGLEALLLDDAVDICIGNNKKAELVPIIEEYIKRVEDGEDPKKLKTLNDTTVIDINHTSEYEDMELSMTADHTRAYIKIQDGCNQFCSYCLIPYARGRVRSRKPLDIIEEVKRMVNAGYIEVVLTGIHISSYGIDFDENYEPRGDYKGESRIVELIEQINSVPGLARLRIGSLEPRVVTKENASRLAACNKLCPHFHLSLQSGCDETLKRMNRHYTADEFRKSVQYLREAFDNPAITTDVIVGFPGETKEEFAASKAFLEEIKFYEMHVFKYSVREGTRAADMPDKVSDSEKDERSNELLQMTEKHSREFRGKYIGRTTGVLFEEEKTIKGKKYLIGHTADYVKVAVPARRCMIKPGYFVLVKMKKFLTDEILLGVYSRQK